MSAPSGGGIPFVTLPKQLNMIASSVILVVMAGIVTFTTIKELRKSQSKRLPRATRIGQ